MKNKYNNSTSRHLKLLLHSNNQKAIKKLKNLNI